MKPLVLVHGFMGGSAQWDGQGPLATSREMISVDLPGFGKNSGMVPINSIAGFANWVLDELSSRGVTKFDLLGHSMGGMIVQEMVHIAPDRIGKLVLYGTGAQGVLPGRFETIETSKQRARADGPGATARRISATWFKDREDAAGFQNVAEIAERTKLPAMLAGLDAMQAWSGADRLGRINQDTLVIWGDCDRTYAWPQIEQLWTTIPQSQLAVIPSVSHAAHAEHPDLFNRLIEDFLTD